MKHKIIVGNTYKPEEVQNIANEFAKTVDHVTTKMSVAGSTLVLMVVYKEANVEVESEKDEIGKPEDTTVQTKKK